MALTNTKERYGTVAQILHWLTAILIIALMIAGGLMGYLPDSAPEEVARKVFVYSMHKTIGVTVLAIVVVRIIWALINPRPKPLHPERKLETLAAETIHWMLYLAILAMPITGLLYHFSTTGFAPIWWPFPQEMPFVPEDETLSKMFGAMHWVLAIIIGGSLLLHIAGALKHAVVDKDETLARMVPGKLDEGFALPQDSHSHKASKLPAFAAFGVVGVALLGMATIVTTQAKVETVNLEPLTINTEDEMVGDHMWRILPEESSLKIRVNQLGSPVEGEFENWTASINFDPENVDKSFVDARIDIASLKLGSVSDQAKSADFLNAETHPQARFLSDFFWLRADRRYEAEGLLEIAGVRKPFVLIFDLQIDGDKALMQGGTVLNRLDYEVGKEKYPNEESVGFNVEVGIFITAEKIK